MKAPVGGNAVDPDLRLRARVRRVASEYRTLAQRAKIDEKAWNGVDRWAHIAAGARAWTYERAAEMLEAEL